MISVIIPVYNVERYVKWCVDSVLNQTYQDLQIILVDDGSTDGSGAVCDALAQQDNRIQVVHKPNGGLSDARNAGMEVATGDYIYFLDGDDVIHPSMFKVLKNAVESGDYDFSMIYLVSVTEEEAADCLKRPENPAPHVFEVDQKDYIKSLFDYGPNYVLNPFVVATNKLFKRNFISDLRFKITGVEDVEFNNRMCQRLTRGIVVEELMYYWIQRGSSLSHANIQKYKLLHFKLYEECLEAIPMERVEHRKVCLNAMFKHILSCRYALRGTDCYEESLKLGAESYKKHSREYFNSDVTLPTRAVVKLFYHYPKIYEWFRAFCHFFFVTMKVHDLKKFLILKIRKIRNKRLVVENEV